MPSRRRRETLGHYTARTGIEWDCNSQPARGESAGELSRASGLVGRLLAALENSYLRSDLGLSPAPPLRPLAGWLAQSAPSLRVTCVPPSPLLMHVISLLGVAHARATSLGHAARGGAPAASPPAGCPLLSLLRLNRTAVMRSESASMLGIRYMDDLFAVFARRASVAATMGTQVIARGPTPAACSPLPHALQPALAEHRTRLSVCPRPRPRTHRQSRSVLGQGRLQGMGQRAASSWRGSPGYNLCTHSCCH